MRFLTLDQFATRHAQYLWRPYLPDDAMVILAGDPGAGKTHVYMTIAAAVTRGKHVMSDAPNGQPGTVIIAQTENDVEVVLRPIFDRAGGDASRVVLLPDLPLADPVKLEAILQQHHPRLVIVDPLQQYLDKTANMDSAKDVRASLSHLPTLAASHHVVFLVVCHLTKDRNRPGVDRIIGSRDISALARSVVLCCRDVLHPRDANGSHFYFGHAKSSYGEEGVTLPYTINDTGLHWGQPVASTINHLIMEEVRQTRRESQIGTLQQARHDDTWLTTLLASGPVTSTVVYDAGRLEGLGRDAVRSALERVGAQQHRLQGAGPGSPWHYSPPAQPTEPVTAPQPVVATAPIIAPTPQAVVVPTPDPVVTEQPIVATTLDPVVSAPAPQPIVVAQPEPVVTEQPVVATTPEPVVATPAAPAKPVTTLYTLGSVTPRPSTVVIVPTDADAAALNKLAVDGVLAVPQGSHEDWQRPPSDLYSSSYSRAATALREFGARVLLLGGVSGDVAYAVTQANVTYARATLRNLHETTYSALRLLVDNAPWIKKVAPPKGRDTGWSSSNDPAGPPPTTTVRVDADGYFIQ